MPVLIFTSSNEASRNIADKLIRYYGFSSKKKTKTSESWIKNGIILFDSKSPTVLDIPTNFETDLLLVLSSHKSRSAMPCLTAHIPGNWNNAELGGEPYTLNIAHAVMLKILIQELDKSKRKARLEWQLCLESDHHGPTCRIPIIFVEIGSSEKEWNNESAGMVVAEAVSNALAALEKYKGTSSSMMQHKTAIGFGGGHYAKEFTKMVLEWDTTIGHICPKYSLDQLNEDMFKQAMDRNIGKADRIIILREGTNASQKKKLEEMADKFGLLKETI